MGCGASTQSGSPPRQLVLLGGGECGKTTIFKQIQIIHGTGFDQEAPQWVDAVQRSPLRSMREIGRKLREPPAEGGAALAEGLSADLRAAMERVEVVANEQGDLTAELAADIAALRAVSIVEAANIEVYESLN